MLNPSQDGIMYSTDRRNPKLILWVGSSLISLHIWYNKNHWKTAFSNCLFKITHCLSHKHTIQEMPGYKHGLTRRANPGPVYHSVWPHETAFVPLPCCRYIALGEGLLCWDSSLLLKQLWVRPSFCKQTAGSTSSGGDGGFFCHSFCPQNKCFPTSEVKYVFTLHVCDMLQSSP